MQLRIEFSAVCAVLLLALLCLSPDRASALPQFLEIAKTTYNFKPGGTIAGKKCSLCHAGVTNATSLNYYGKDLQSALKSSGAEQVTPELLHSLDSKDSDGDGFPNSDEFKADTLPGDPASRPNGPPPGSLKPSEAGKRGDEANPFSLKSILFPSHAQHPIIVHFPIALFVFSMILDALGLWKRKPEFIAAGYFNLVASAVTGILAVATGFLAWRIQRGGESLLEDKILMFHLILAVTTTVLICLLWLIRARQSNDPTHRLNRLYIILAVITLLVITLTGHLGGILTGVVQ